MKIGDLVLVCVARVGGVYVDKVGMITAIDVRDYSDDVEPWTAYKVLVGDEIITTHTGKIRPCPQNTSDNMPVS